jgi:Predicted membrane protein
LRLYSKIISILLITLKYNDIFLCGQFSLINFYSNESFLKFILSIIKINCTFAVIMRKVLTISGLWIQKKIDFTYPLFRKIFSPQLYRYGVCGGANIVFDWVLYFLVYNFIFKHRFVDIGFITLSPHIVSFIIIFPITTLSGFLLQKYVTFTASSDLRGRVQLIRYLLIVLANLLINYVGLKLLVDGFDFYPTPSKMIITIVTVICSYIGQKKFTFKVSQQSEKPE